MDHIAMDIVVVYCALLCTVHYCVLCITVLCTVSIVYSSISLVCDTIIMSTLFGYVHQYRLLLCNMRMPYEYNDIVPCEMISILCTTIFTHTKTNYDVWLGMMPNTALVQVSGGN